MTEQDAINLFGTDVINLPSKSQISVADFALLFKDAPSTPTYDDLIRIDAGRLGYKLFFDQCKAEGILTD